MVKRLLKYLIKQDLPIPYFNLPNNCLNFKIFYNVCGSELKYRYCLSS